MTHATDGGGAPGGPSGGVDPGLLEVRSPLEEFLLRARERLRRARAFGDEDPEAVAEALRLGAERLAQRLGLEVPPDPAGDTGDVAVGPDGASGHGGEGSPS